MTAPDPAYVAEILAKPEHQRTARECRIVRAHAEAAGMHPEFHHDEGEGEGAAEELLRALEAGAGPAIPAGLPTVSGPEILAILSRPPVEGGKPVPLEVPGLVQADDARGALAALAELHRRRSAERAEEFNAALAAIDRGEDGPDPELVQQTLDAEDEVIRGALEEAKRRIVLDDGPIPPAPWEGTRVPASHRHRLELATRLLAAWTVGKPDTADQINMRLAVHTVNLLDKLVAGEAVEFVLDGDPAVAFGETKPKE